jgi:hypothetical protein
MTNGSSYFEFCISCPRFGKIDDIFHLFLLFTLFSIFTFLLTPEVACSWVTLWFLVLDGGLYEEKSNGVLS